MPERKYGVLVISHGSRSEEWVRLVDEAVAEVRAPGGIPIVSSFLEIVEGRLIQDGIAALENEGVTDLLVVPLFVSSGSTHLDEIGFALGVIPQPLLPTEMTPFERTARVHMAAPIDDDPVVAELVYDKVRELSREPQREVLLLVGHGSAERGFHQRWQRGLKRLAERVRLIGGFAAADTAMLLPDQTARKLRRWQERRQDYAIVAAPLFLSEGYFTQTVVPQRLEGRHHNVRYNGRALLPSPLVSRWMERQIERTQRLAQEQAAAPKPEERRNAARGYQSQTSETHLQSDIGP
ncbi:sirohydrochlorin chelatase [Gordoniibacillus kamchatkensis]|uniref:sirohydrochlorin chelatase n=1 Tax=Gordoniibacillus kamchatkensis TaxID=1590651 RepID=UPI0009E4749C|nr:CbiX/SirB N-terminal domain-containing protein [Paenibacillus sp. VKM B-2647]